MIRANFRKTKGLYSGFSISGHAGYADRGYDVVCAAVSSATQLIVNIMNEMGCAPMASAEGDTVSCDAGDSPETASRLIGQFMAHLDSILEEYPKTIKITISEV